VLNELYKLKRHPLDLFTFCPTYLWKITIF
jgi:hypothetical protein